MQQHYRQLFQPDSVSRSAGVYTVATVGQRGLGLLRNLVLAWLLSEAEYGLLGLALLLANLLLPVVSAGLYEGAQRYAPQHETAGSLAAFARRLLVTLGAISVTVALALIGLAPWLGSLLFQTAGAGSAQAVEVPASATVALTRTVAVCVLTLAVFHTLIGWLRGLRLFRAVSAIEVGAAVVFTAGAIVCPLAGADSAAAVVWIYTASNLAAVAFAWPGVRQVLTHQPAAVPTGDVEALPPQAARGRWLAFSLWAAITALLWHGLAYVPAVFLVRAAGAQTVGWFHGIRTIGQLLQVAGVTLAALVTAHVTPTWERGERTRARQQLDAFTLAALLVLLGAATVLGVAKPLLLRLLPAAFTAAGGAYEPALLSFALIGVAAISAIRLNLLERPRLVSLAWLVAVGVAAGTAHAWVQEPGPAADAGKLVEAAAWASVAGTAAACVVLAVLVAACGQALRGQAYACVAGLVLVGLGWATPTGAGLAVLAAGVAVAAGLSPRLRRKLAAWVDSIRG